MKDSLAEMEKAVRETEILSYEYAQLDFAAHGASTRKWIASHEKLRMAALKLQRHRDALQKQITELNTQLAEKATA